MGHCVGRYRWLRNTDVIICVLATSSKLIFGSSASTKATQSKASLLPSRTFLTLPTSIFKMPSRKDKIADTTVADVYHGDAPLRSKLPRPVQFPLVVVLSLVSSALLYSFAAEYTTGELATVSRSLNEWWEVGALLGWRTSVAPV